jgi:hypothetical protein
VVVGAGLAGALTGAGAVLVLVPLPMVPLALACCLGLCHTRCITRDQDNNANTCSFLGAALNLADMGFKVSVFEKRLPEAILPGTGFLDTQQQHLCTQPDAAAMRNSTLGVRSYSMVLSERYVAAFGALLVLKCVVLTGGY